MRLSVIRAHSPNNNLHLHFNLFFHTSVGTHYKRSQLYRALHVAHSAFYPSLKKNLIEMSAYYLRMFYQYMQKCLAEEGECIILSYAVHLITPSRQRLTCQKITVHLFTKHLLFSSTRIQQYQLVDFLKVEHYYSRPTEVSSSTACQDERSRQHDAISGQDPRSVCIFAILLNLPVPC